MGKPEATFFQTAISDLGCSALETVMIGDVSMSFSMIICHSADSFLMNLKNSLKLSFALSMIFFFISLLLVLYHTNIMLYYIYQVLPGCFAV